MSQISDYDRFLKLEEDFNLFEFVVDGVKVWERIRFQVFNAITRRSIKGASAQLTKQSVLLRLKRLLFSIFAIKRNPLLTPRADFLFICSARRLHEADGLWWDIYTDPIMDALRSPFVAIETHFMNGHYRPEKTQTLRYFDFIDFISFILRATRVARANLTREDIRTIRRIEQKILKDFKFRLNVEELFRRTIEERKVRLPLYKLLLNRIRPTVVILAQGYGWETMVEACKSSTIPTIELQHGVISQESAAYSFPSDFRKKEMFADYLFVFGDFWKSSANFPIQRSHIISVGYPHFESERQKYSKLLKQKQILFISQAPVGEALSRIASELGSIKDFGYRILYKLHPLERDGWREKYPWLMQSEVEVIDQKEDILYRLFAESLIQIGVYSTAIYEGLGYALRTFILDVPESIYSKALIEGNLATKFASTSELKDLIENSPSSNQVDIEYIFKSNAVENIISAIKKIANMKSSLRK